MKTIHADGSIMGHRFEAAKLGVAPFQYIGMSENAIRYPDGTTQAGGSCDYCGTGIRYEFAVRDSVGKVFKVGCECIRHATGDSKLVALVESDKRKHDKAKRAIKAAAQREREEIQAADMMPKYRAAMAKLETMPHPNEYFASKGKTMADYFRYFEYADGTKAKIDKILDAIKRAKEIA